MIGILPSYDELKAKVAQLEDEVKILRECNATHASYNQILASDEQNINHIKLLQYQSYIRLSPIAIYSTGFDSNIDTTLPVETQIDQIYEKAFLEECNMAMVKSYGFSSPDEFIGKRMIHFHNGKHNEVNRNTFRNFITNGYKSVNRLTEEIDIHGETIYFISNDIGIIENGFLTRIWGSAINATEQRRTENALKKAKDKAEESDRLKSTFLQNISHEIRTPMNAICGFSDLIITPGISDEKKVDFNKIIHKSANQLLNAIENIITLSFIETEQITLNNTSFKADNIVKEVFDNYKHLKIKLEKEHIDFNYKITGQTELFIHTDYQKLYQILTILLDNAFKFTQTGSIEIGCIAEYENIRFYVKDTGIGIPLDKQEIIFKSFTQANDTVRQLFGGIGIGLTIVVGLIKLIHGKLNVNSEEDKGTIIEFALPHNYQQKSFKQPNMEQLQSLKNKTLLVAEDEQFNFIYVEQILEELQMNILHAVNGLHALELFNQNKVDLILMDIKMPKMDGFEATKLIRESNLHVPIIAQTAFSYKREECLAGGFTDYLTKPYRPEDLTQMLEKHISD